MLTVSLCSVTDEEEAGDDEGVLVVISHRARRGWGHVC